MNDFIKQANVERFSGFSDIYNMYRPQAPRIIVDIILKYLTQPGKPVVDDICAFKDTVYSELGEDDVYDLYFSYRMRLGVK